MTCLMESSMEGKATRLSVKFFFFFKFFLNKYCNLICNYTKELINITISTVTIQAELYKTWHGGATGETLSNLDLALVEGLMLGIGKK